MKSKVKAVIKPLKKTKIVCTLGPASQDIKILSKMVQSGMNVVRLNFSHGSYDNHHALMASVRKVSKAENVPIAILQDLQGPKIRVGNLTQTVEIKTGQTVTIGKDFTMDFDISGSVKPGERILIEDGLLEMVVSKVSGKNIACRVSNGGTVRSHKGINIPDSEISFPVMTEKDKRDLKFGLENDVDYVAISFVRNRADLVNLKKMIDKWNPKNFVKPLVIAKIEKPEAIKNFDEILEASDGIMIARGDLGVELPDWQVPVLQKEIIEKCRLVGKPVIVATQMLDSMIRNPRPTRAEVSDVANAVIDGTDAVMLSGESAFGSYPLGAVQEMNDIVLATEQSAYFETSDVFSKKASIDIGAVGGLVANFEEAMALSNQRPDQALLLSARNPKVHRQLSLLSGVYQGTAIPIKPKDFVSRVLAIAKSVHAAKKGSYLMILKYPASALADDYADFELKKV
jgi:pyruvate kinase